ncbi:MAG: hypothetical protein O3A95_06725 [Planctomycetota bacterium]|nr:hypothetical protein [Planctomycetota bacterium]MDA1113976.1 hypothetical protein [Planctomycetota bacterium]
MNTNTKGPFQLFYEHIYVIVLVTAVAVISAYFVTGSITPQYRSQARTYLPNATDTVSLTSEAGNVPNSPLLPTANPDFQSSLLGVLNAADTRILVASNVPERDSEWLKKNVEFKIDRYNLITITAFDPEPKMALKVANEYLRAFTNKIDDTTKQRADGRQATFAAGITTSSKELKGLEAGRLDFMREHGAIDFTSELAELNSRQIEYQNRITSNITTLAGLVAQRITMQSLLEARPETAETSSTLVNNPLLEELKRNLSTANRERVGLALQFTPNHPDVIAKEKEIDSIGAEIALMEEIVRGSSTLGPDALHEDLQTRLVDLDLRVAALTKQGELYEDVLETTKARRLELSLLQVELEAMDARINNVRQTLTNYRDRKAELDIYLSRNPTFLLTPELPVEAAMPYLPILWVNLLVAAILGLSISIVLVLIMAQANASQEKNLW